MLLGSYNLEGYGRLGMLHVFWERELHTGLEVVNKRKERTWKRECSWEDPSKILLEKIRCDVINRIHLALESYCELGDKYFGSINCGGIFFFFS
jgi:hypothetical protein